MKLLLLTLAFVSSQVYAHGHHHHGHSHGVTDQAVTSASVCLNTYEIITHGASILGLGNTNGCCGSHMSNTYHILEIAGHTSNLYGGVSHLMETYTTPTVIWALSLGFNTWAGYNQYQSLKNRGLGPIGIILAPMATMDLWGHIVGAYVAARELVGI